MSVRKTESRVPSNFQVADLGQAVTAADGKSALVSYISSPLVLNRSNTYVVFVTDAGLAAQVQTYEWIFSENGAEAHRETTSIGEYRYAPQAAGNLSLTVNLAGVGSLGSLALSQEIVALNSELETMIAEANSQTGPGIANPEVARELVNDYNVYYRAVQPTVPESGDGFFKLLFDQVYDGALRFPPERRRIQLAQIADILNGDSPNLDLLANAAAGVCGIRLALLAMALPLTPGGSDTYLPWTEFPESAPANVAPLQSLMQQFNNLNPDDKIDLFNLLRFPKSNIAVCGKTLEALRNHYFPGTPFADVLTGFSGVRLEAIVKHFREGPVLRP